jgi:hypothetical protein
MQAALICFESPCHRILLNVNLQTPEHPITVGPQHIIAAEKAA